MEVALDRAGLAESGLLRRLRVYRSPLLATAIALPLTVYAVAVSLAWIGAIFPGFLVLSDGVIPTVSALDWPPDRQAVFHAQVVAVDGQRVGDSAAILAAVATRSEGTPIEYQLRRAGVAFTVTLPARRFGVSDYLQTFGILLVFGGAWLGCGVTVGMLQPATRQAQVFLLQSVIAGLYPITAIFLYQPGFVWLGRLCVILECLLGATWAHLALVFPVERRLGGWQRSIVRGLYALGLALGAGVLWGLSRTPPSLAPLYVEYSFAAGGLAAFLVALVAGYRENPGGRVRLRMRALLPGAVVAASLAGFALLNSVVAGRNFPVQFGLLLSPLFSASVAYAIATQDLFDIDRVVRQSFVYALLTLIVTSAYAVTLAISSSVLPESDRATAILSMLFVAVIAFALEPLRLGIQRAVDRAFFRTRLDYRKTVVEVGDAMTTILRLDDIVSELTRVGTDIMQLEAVSLAVLEHDGAGRLWTRRAIGGEGPGVAPACVGDLARAAEALGGVALTSDVLAAVADPAARSAAAEFLAGVRTAVVLPLTFQRQVTGLLLLGPKRSGRMLSSDDVELLRTLASQAAIAVQNARSYQALEALTRELDSKVQQRTAELRASNAQLSDAYDELKQAQSQIMQSEKMASLGQLVAGVAHELNNPASFIHGGLQNLARYLDRLTELLHAYERVTIADPTVAGQLAAARRAAHLDALLRETPTLLRICSEGSERIKKIVEDLRVFVRADQGDRVSVEIAEGLDNTLRLLGDRIGRAAVEIHRDYCPVPRIAGQSGQLNQVWMNLLVNALDAVEGVANPAIHVAVGLTPPRGSVRASADGSDGAAPGVQVVIRDNGSGMSPETRAKVFEPFFTTKPIGRGTGLGLSIVYGAVKNHGGTIEIESAVGSGTTVTVALPVIQ